MRRHPARPEALPLQADRLQVVPEADRAVDLPVDPVGGQGARGDGRQDAAGHVEADAAGDGTDLAGGCVPSRLRESRRTTRT